MVSRKIKTLIHVHTDYSFDSDVSVEALADFARRERVGCIAVTDHDTIAGALALSRVAPAGTKIIVGAEITTRDGHLIGLFLKQDIEPGMSARETALEIRRQGGLVLLPHPFVAAFGCGLRGVSHEIVDLIDAVEVNNGQNLLSGPDRKAEAFARKFGLPVYCGADSHSQTSLMPCHQLLEPFDGTPAGFLRSLGRAELSRGRHPLSYFVAAAVRVVRHAAGLPLPRGFGAQVVTPTPHVHVTPVAAAA